MSNTDEKKKNISNENSPVSKPSFLVEDAASIEMTSENGKQSIQKIDPSLRPNVGEQIIEGERSAPSHPQSKKPHFDDQGVLHE